MTKKQLINEGKLEQALTILKSVADSNSVPRNIRKIVKEAIVMLNDTETSISIRAANAIAFLEDVSQDPNMPSYSRVTIWSAVSNLESIRE
tara:strand:+ start:1262 stop:1534 length:273 start_codon:yes stop_codon:yes gene_type:complete